MAGGTPPVPARRSGPLPVGSPLPASRSAPASFFRNPEPARRSAERAGPALRRGSLLDRRPLRAPSAGPALAGYGPDPGGSGCFGPLFRRFPFTLSAGPGQAHAPDLAGP